MYVYESGALILINPANSACSLLGRDPGFCRDSLLFLAVGKNGIEGEDEFEDDYDWGKREGVRKGPIGTLRRKGIKNASA
jgi:hypothetical protein